jgi:hypothetical protein
MMNSQIDKMHGPVARRLNDRLFKALKQDQLRGHVRVLLGSKDSSRHLQTNYAISYFLPTFNTPCMYLNI